MNLVIDTNQIGKLPSTDEVLSLFPNYQGIALPGLVVAEILLSKKRQEWFETLASFELRFGKFLSVMNEELAALDENGIREFVPFEPANTDLGRGFQRILASQPVELIEGARKQKANSLSLLTKLIPDAQMFRKHLNDLRSQGDWVGPQKFSGIDHVLQCVGNGPQSFLGDCILKGISNGGTRDLRVCSDELLFNAVLGNRFLSRYFKVLLYYFISISRLWADQRHNFDPSSDRNDVTDISLALYLDDGDTLLTRDTKVQRALEMISPSIQVTSFEEV